MQIALLLFILGLIVGSFLNVVGLRWGSGKTLGGRSMCFACGKSLSWPELIPVASFLALGGKCRGCKTRISLQYPVVEILTGLVFLSIYNLQFSIYKEFSALFFVHSLLLFVVFSIYIVIGIYDLKHKIIPDELVYSTIVLSLGIGLLRFVWDLNFGIWDLAAGVVIFLFFASLWFFSRGRAMGFGDAKLGLSIGLLLGASAGFSAIVLSFWIGAFVALSYMALSRIVGLFKRGKRLTMKSEIPFAPFMILSAWLSLIFDLNILNVPF